MWIRLNIYGNYSDGIYHTSETFSMGFGNAAVTAISAAINSRSPIFLQVITTKLSSWPSWALWYLCVLCVGLLLAAYLERVHMLTFPEEQCHTTETHSSDSQFKELFFTVISSFWIKITYYIACACVWGCRSKCAARGQFWPGTNYGHQATVTMPLPLNEHTGPSMLFNLRSHFYSGPLQL